MADLLPLTITDVRQYLYCARVFYHTVYLGATRPVTFKMQEGVRQHEDEAAREERRSLRAYGLREGERVLDVRLASTRLGLSGRLDMAIRSGHEAIPVEHKHSTAAVGTHQRYQLAAYAMLLEEAWGRPVRRSFVYQIPLRRAVEVPIRAGMRRYVSRTLAAMRLVMVHETTPPATRHSGRCRECEFRRFCGDTT
ncbi:MAG TPA: CRISPR-associated protein Cas4 [Anaerolineae bacterium]|nr:CRISPR-associated protein Cas4 [Anaerolineae bacterium]HOR00080.1 CRISPR-associated protein Cas4 [Anaerolineae bacterium]HPL29233.1 CRISPR-associated protein Cas4 [Anaerolineae bacterium]